jgi:hypothetical protein
MVCARFLACSSTLDPWQPNKLLSQAVSSDDIDRPVSWRNHELGQLRDRAAPSRARWRRFIVRRAVALHDHREQLRARGGWRDGTLAHERGVGRRQAAALGQEAARGVDGARGSAARCRRTRRLWYRQRRMGARNAAHGRHESATTKTVGLDDESGGVCARARATSSRRSSYSRRSSHA